ncbi:MAG: NAD-dependent epimerase/dehydratase family protein [Hyphomicrobiales bacterium]
MRVFVLGGTGSIGGPLVRCLVRRGHGVMALARSPGSADRLRDAGADPVDGDIADPGPWIDALDKADAVIHAASTFGDDMAVIDRRLMDAAIARLGARDDRPGLVYTGGCWLFGDTGGFVIDETAPFDAFPSDAWATEGISTLLSAPGIQAMVVHPAMVYDGVGGVFGQFSESARAGGPVPVTQSAETYWPLVHADDLAELYALIVERPQSGTQYHGSTIEGVQVGEIARAIARRFGVPEELRVVPVEDDIAMLGAWARGRAVSQRMSGARAMRELGWNPVHRDVFADIAAAEI